MDKHCYECKNYCQLVNQGIWWWCRLQKDVKHPELCDSYEPKDYTANITTASTE